MLVLRDRDCGAAQGGRSADCGGWSIAGEAAQARRAHPATAMAQLAVVRSERAEAAGPARGNQRGVSSLLDILLPYGEDIHRYARRTILHNSNLHGKRPQWTFGGGHAPRATSPIVSG